ncbi:MAG: phosphoheptose isomerase [Clostridiales bacterium]|nr:phosphoheptose isomerase [Clostridiales bacterium]
MSFMFNPYPFDDPAAVNHITAPDVDLSTIKTCPDCIKSEITKAAKQLGRGIIAVDGYVTAPFDTFAKLVSEAVADAGIKANVVCTRSLARPSDELKQELAEYLPEDKAKDPVLLYGKIYDKGYRGLMDAGKVSAMLDAAKAFDGITVIVGNGALAPDIIGSADYKIFADITPKMAVLNVKKGGYRNYGCDEELPFKIAMRRNYYVDFDQSFNLRKSLLETGNLDLYIAADKPEALIAMPYDTMKKLLSRATDYPFRCKPVYLEGVWGGYMTMKERNLPKEMKNAAWIFDLIPMEVSIVLEVGGLNLEFPYYTLIGTNEKKLLGEQCLKDFNGFFPIRFNFDDTFHSNGNMSIQLHPGEKFLKENSNELGRQDESYYIIATAQDAKTYLGFKQDADIDQFLSDIKRSETAHTEVDYQKYINAVESKPGVQVMIPHGTIHASGRNQLILEIGSLTVGSYTYKMYDYLRKDLDGNPRPIHSYYGEMNLNRDMREDYVYDNLVNGNKRTLRSGDGWEEYVVGECDRLYFSLRNEKFVEKIEDNTNDDFHVLTLVDGEEVEIRSKKDPSLSFTQKFLDIVVVPASMGEYEIINKKPGTVVVEHKTMLKR